MFPTTTNEIRSAFLEFFRGRDHEILPSASLLPVDDDSLMFTNSGMVRFKSMFVSPPIGNKNFASCQKCVRAGGKHNDLENVGYTARHHTFFEMLGNFSFGGYYKKQAITYAWEFLTKTLGISPDKLYVTVYHDDNESYDIWKELTGFDDSKIIRISTDDNFWSAGNTGLCGPSTEIFYDHGDHIDGGLPGTKNQHGDRFVEIWNLVFTQYERQEDGQLIPLSVPCVDTGIGLERIAAVQQGVVDNYDIDIFTAMKKVIIDNETKRSFYATPSEELTAQMKISHKVVSDHMRCAVFLIGGGLLPSSTGAGYVLRKIIRRMVKYKKTIDGYRSKLCLTRKHAYTLKNQMGDVYPEDFDIIDKVIAVIVSEETNFYSTLFNAYKLFSKHVLHSKRTDKFVSGELIFKLKDTHGIPLDLSQQMIKEHGLEMDMKGYFDCMAKQRANSKRIN